MMIKKKHLLITTATLFFSTLLLILYLYLYNFHTVIPGEVYRGPQYNKADLESIITHYHIRSVLNLRESRPTAHWYTEEIAATQAMNVQHIDLPLDAHNLPDIPTLKHLVSIMDQASYRPMFLHCRHGADRSGMASAIALLLSDDRSIDSINKQTSIKYFVTAPDSVGKQFLRLYEAWLTKNHLTTSRVNFLAWINQLSPSNYLV